VKSPRAAALVLAFVAVVSCGPKRPPVTKGKPAPERSPAATAKAGHPAPVVKADGEVIVSAWSEPRQLPPGGGQAQLIVRLRKRGGAPYPGVQVRLGTTSGSLFSRGQVLVTEPNGITRDRLSTNSTARVTVNAGGTIYSFDVPVSSGS
jgi:hypothetical protein